MPSTDRLKLPLYTDEETPDISTSGHYNESMRLVDAEAAKLEAADAAIKSDIDTEVARATAAEQANASAITAEVTRATAADETNANAITAEVSRATAAEQANAEATAALDTKLTGVSKRVESNTSNIAKEITDRQGAVQAEATARTEADTALGKRIDKAEVEISTKVGLTFHHQKRMITNTLSGDGVDMGGAELASAEFYSPELAKIFTIENHSTTPTSITLIFGKSASAQTYVNTATVLGPSNTQGQIPVLLSNGTFETWTVQIVSSVFRLIHPARTAALSGDWFLWAIDYIA